MLARETAEDHAAVNRAMAALIERAIEGNRQAARELVDWLTPTIQKRVMRALLRRRHADHQRDIRQEVEDLTQSVFGALFKNDGQVLRRWDGARGTLERFVGVVAEILLKARVMTEHELLKAVTEAARKQDLASDPRYDARIEGALSEQEEKEALSALDQSSPARREAWEASEPLDDDARKRITDQILARLPMQGESSGSAPASGRRMRSLADEPRDEGGRLIPLLARRFVPSLIFTAGVLAAAAALLFFLPPVSCASDPMPAYALFVSSGERDQQSDVGTQGAALPRLGPGSRLEMTLRPATLVKGAVAVQGFLIHDGRAQRWDVQADVSPEGAVRIAGEKEALFGGAQAGRFEIALAVGRPSALPSDPEAVLAVTEKGPSSDGWYLLRQPILLLGPDLSEGRWKPSPSGSPELP
jgi:hypothetical protein